jgi:Tol biopolymer transport system component
MRTDLKRLKRDTSSSRSEAPHESASDSVIIAGLIKGHKRAAIGSLAVVAALVVLTWFFLSRPPNPLAELTQKQMTLNSSENPVRSVAISPDGKYLAYSDPAGIHLKLLSTSEERLIPRPAGAPAAFWDVDSWFPDGTRLLADTEEPGRYKSMWTVSVLGLSPRVLRQGASGFEVSPNGTRIAFSPGATLSYHREIWAMGSQGDNPQKVLAAGENERLWHVHWSPDGQRLAYIKDQRISDRYQTSIETCDLKGASRTVVVSYSDLGLYQFCWLPEGRMVYERQDAHSTEGANLWQVGIDNHAGTPAGKPKRITQWAGSYLGGVSASADGKRLVLSKTTSQGQVYLAELTAGGTPLNPPRRLTNDEASEMPWAWTADSQAVLVSSTRNGASGIFKQGISQEASEPVVTGPHDISVPRLSPDGTWILFLWRVRQRKPILPLRSA